MKLTIPPRPKPRIEMLPLIDIVFLLLVAFIYAMLSMAVHRGLPVSLPSSEAARLDKELTLSVTVDQDGRVYLDKSPIALSELAAACAHRTDPAHPGGVLLFAHKKVSYQTLFRVLDQINRAGITRISLQAQAETIH